MRGRDTGRKRARGRQRNTRLPNARERRWEEALARAPTQHKTAKCAGETLRGSTRGGAKAARDCQMRGKDAGIKRARGRQRNKRLPNARERRWEEALARAPTQHKTAKCAGETLRGSTRGGAKAARDCQMRGKDAGIKRARGRQHNKRLPNARKRRWEEALARAPTQHETAF